MNRLLICVAVFACGVVATSTPAAENASGRMLRDAALMLMKEGNARFVMQKTQHPNLDQERRSSLASGGQEPFATILACSDARVPVELVFDRGVGDLFVVRTAGNIAGQSELASMEYGVGHLNTPVLLVLGHSKCGAVTAVTKNTPVHGHLRLLASKIQPAVDKAKSESTDPEEHLPRAVEANVWNAVESTIRESEIIRDRVAAGSVFVVGAIYDLDTGKVSWLGSHPAQEAIVALASQSKTDASLSLNGRATGATRAIVNPDPVKSKVPTLSSGPAH